MKSILCVRALVPLAFIFASGPLAEAQIYQENFETTTGSALPTGWFVRPGKFGLSTVNPAPSAANSSTRVLSFSQTTSFDDTFSPAFDLSSYKVTGQRVTLSFDFFSTATTNHGALIGLASDRGQAGQGSTLSWLAASPNSVSEGSGVTNNGGITFSGSGAWRTVSVDLTPYIGAKTATELSATYLAFEWWFGSTGALNTTARVYIDNLRVSAAATAPTITVQPQDQVATAGATVAYTVAATGSAPLVYQWRKAGVSISGATNATLVLSGVQFGDSGLYEVVVSNSAGSATGGGARLYVGQTGATYRLTTPVPEASDLLAAVRSQFGAGATIADWNEIKATFGSNLNAFYQMIGLENSLEAMVTAGGARYIGGSRQYYLQRFDAGPYSGFGIHDQIGALYLGSWFGFTLPVLAKVGPAATLPSITTPPLAQNVAVGGSVTFSVVAAGTAPLAYQWRKDGGAISGATNSSFTRANAQPADAGDYTVAVSNVGGSVTSPAARLTVTTVVVAPTITSQTRDQTVLGGQNVTLQVGVSGTAPFSFQWRRNGVPIAGQTTDMLVLVAVGAAAEGAYTVLISNTAGSATSEPIRLVVGGAPTISVEPVAQSVARGSNPSMSVVANGTGEIRYQWYKDTRAIAGATNAILALNAVDDSDAGSYAVAVNNTLGTATSRTVTLQVGAPDSRLTNLSLRSNISPQGESVTLGFVVAGEGTSKRVMVRGVGPTLANADFGISPALPDPRLDLFSGSVLIDGNNNWGDQGTVAATQVAAAAVSAGAFALNNASLDAALLKPLPKGAYTALIGANSGTGAGIGLVEVYDSERESTLRFVNVSARALVGTGDQILIVGFAVTGNVAKSLLVRAVGPTLGGFGVTGVLADPQLVVEELNTRALIAPNDDWGSYGGAAALTEIFVRCGAFPLVPNSKDAALRVNLDPGTYSVRVVGANNTTGAVLVEIYEVP